MARQRKKAERSERRSVITIESTLSTDSSDTGDANVELRLRHNRVPLGTIFLPLSTWSIVAHALAGVNLNDVDIVILPDADTCCDSCGGFSGIRDHSHPDCTPELYAGEHIVERCDTCNRFSDDLEAAKTLYREARWVLCARGTRHAVVRTDSLRKETHRASK